MFPWGKHEIQVLPMGLYNGPDVFQEKISTLFAELNYVRTYIDDLLVTTKGDLDDHLEKLDVVLRKLKCTGLKINANKSFFCQHKTRILRILDHKRSYPTVTRKGQGNTEELQNLKIRKTYGHL